MKRKLNDWLDGYMYYTDNSEPPDSFRLWTGLSVIAAALQRKCYLDFGMLTFYPNMYVLLVGPPASKKGTALAPGYDMLFDLGVKLSADATTREALIRRLREATSNEVLANNKLYFHSSMTIFSKEFTVFLGYKNQELIAALCDWYDCGKKWTYDTKGQGTDEVIGVWVNLIGATTPELLQMAMPSEVVGGGLASRIVFVVEEGRGKICPYTFLTKEQMEVKEYLVQDLSLIHSLSGQFRMTRNFMDKWIEWYTETETGPPVIKDPKFSAYLGRRPQHIMKLCMILCASRSQDMILEDHDLDRAIGILQSAEINMTKAFTGIGKSPISELLPRIMREIAVGGKVHMAHLMGKFYQDADKHLMSRALETLESMGFLKIVHTPGEGQYLVYNPDCKIE